VVARAVPLRGTGPPQAVPTSGPADAHGASTMQIMVSGLDAGFLLDRQWHWLRGEMEKSKRPALLAVCRILGEERVLYAIIGGLALQVHHPEPRTTLDIDIALPARDAIPAAALEKGGFRRTGSFERSENWVASDGTPIQFTDDPLLAPAIAHAEEIVLDRVVLRVVRVVDLLHAKLRAGSDPARRRSKRLQDLADVAALLEANENLRDELTESEKALLDELPE
jgi:hypothetical protein